MLPGQASTLGRFFYPQSKSTTLTLLASSAQGENSYAHSSDPSLGVAVVDRFTLRLVQQVMQHPGLALTPESIGRAFPRRLTLSTAVLVRAPAEESDREKLMYFRDFFAAVDGDNHIDGKKHGVIEREGLILRAVERAVHEKHDTTALQEEGDNIDVPTDCFSALYSNDDSHINNDYVEDAFPEIDYYSLSNWGSMLLWLWFSILFLINLIAYNSE